MVRFELKQAAREHCAEALEVIVRCMRSDDVRVALMAASILLDRGYGKPERQSDVEVNRKFVVAPDTMALDRWLERRGQPEPLELKAEADEDDPDKLN
jgi:hypothetical protein